jgi:hypothetical protein
MRKKDDIRFFRAGLLVLGSYIAVCLPICLTCMIISKIRFGMFVPWQSDKLFELFAITACISCLTGMGLAMGYVMYLFALVKRFRKIRLSFQILLRKPARLYRSKILHSARFMIRHGFTSGH